jgi:hypothetical protein
MTPKELAQKLNGREIGNEISQQEHLDAAKACLVVVYGASDDLMEFRGAIYDEVSCSDGGTAYLDKAGLLQRECEDENCPHEERKQEECKTIEAVWCDADGAPWTYKTKIPHEKFDIFEDGELFCVGIVFHIEDLI